MPAEGSSQSISPLGAEAESRGLPCGGRLKIVIEPLRQPDDSGRLLETVARQGSIKRSLHLATGAVTHGEAAVGTQVTLTDEYFHNVFEADWRLMIIGAGELATFSSLQTGSCPPGWW